MRGGAIIVGASMHAAGHAFLAAAAGLLARSLAGEASLMDDRSGVLHGWIGPLQSAARGAATSSDGVVLAVAMGGFFAAIVKLVGGALAAWAEARVAGEVAAEVRLSVLEDVLALRRPPIDAHPSVHGPRQNDHGSTWVAQRASTDGDRLAALTSHVAEIERGVAHGVLAELHALVMLVPLGALLVVLAPKLAGSAALALAGFGLLAFGLRRAFKRALARSAASAGALVAAADEAVKHAELWATYGAKRRIRAHVARVGRAIAREAAGTRMRAALLSSTSEVLGALALVLVLVLASRGALGVDHGKVVPFAIAFFMAYRPLRELVDGRLARARGEEALAAALGDVGFGDASASRTAPDRGLVADWALEPLVLASVRTRYGAHPPLTRTIPAGAIAVIVGPTGSGKTSLLRALLGLERFVEGGVRYGARDLGDRGVGPSARPFAWVPQDAPIVRDTLAINVGLGRADDASAPPDPAPMLAELGNEHLAKILGDAVLGTTRALSGGERQWIAAARALATGLPVLLFDEPTSALDGASQARLLEAISGLRGKRTILLVTHRPEPLAIADVIVRIEPTEPREAADVRLLRADGSSGQVSP